MKLRAYKLNFTGPLHISDARSDYGTGETLIHSDGFYAALIASLAKLGVEVSADLHCTISSLFPFTSFGKDLKETIYFFPKPFLDFHSYTDYDDIKKLKRIEWLDKSYFEELLKGEIDKPINETTIQKSFLSEKKINPEFIERQVVPRVAIPRSKNENDGETNIFYIEKTYFEKGSGLFFLQTGETELLEQALNLLQHEGIGTDRYVGFGSFTFEKIEDFNLEIPDSTNYSVALSLFNPGEDFSLKSSLQDKNTAWDIIKRGGWITTEGNIGSRKKSVYMFREGSIFKELNNRNTAGKIDIDLKPDESEGFTPPEHPIWRNGKALFLPIKLKEQ